MKKKTISIPDKVYAKLQKERGRRIAESGESLSFSRFIVEKLEKSGKGRAKTED